MEFDLEMNLNGFVGSQVLPVINVDRESGKFGKIPLEQLLQSADTKRAAGAGYSRGNWSFTDESFVCEEYGHEEPVDDREAKIYADYFDAELVSTLRARSTIMVEAEKRIAAAVYNETTFSGQITTVTNEWDDATNCTPIVDVNTAINLAYDRTGIWPDSLVINKKVFRNLRASDKVKDAIASSGAGDPTKQSDITVQMIAQCFDLRNVFVAGGSTNSAAEGQTAVPAQIWSDEYAMVFKAASSDDIREACLGRTFHYGGDGSQANGAVESYRDENVRADIVRVRHDVDEKILYSEVGQLLKNITT
tara:strand:+ start:2902 stop:3819 length:918 start_codon:yes stop_codon:yes gene_type:complete